ncbi:acyl carrier protein [Paraburkholderia solisilvae]|uniref:Acyl carrier protein n=1 Tax=Paraburkholderia solisilvae TaxID=624376 RepID=A0A6J5CYP6_9BURK|nr:acyl carrier protein [Paraburkholderia solisilvae]CAB3745975.1 Acyl carrier protein [Paraburkholderia solisilvae]
MTKQRQDTAEKIRALVAHHFGMAIEDVHDELSFREDLGADSLDMMDFAIELEAHFGMSVPNEDVELLGSVGEAIRWMLQRPEKGSVEKSRSERPADIRSHAKRDQR